MWSLLACWWVGPGMADYWSQGSQGWYWATGGWSQDQGWLAVRPQGPEAGDSLLVGK